jgi:hypothetical protein
VVEVGDVIRVIAGDNFGKIGFVKNITYTKDHGAYPPLAIVRCHPKLIFGKSIPRDAEPFECFEGDCVVIQKGG